MDAFDLIQLQRKLDKLDKLDVVDGLVEALEDLGATMTDLRGEVRRMHQSAKSRC